MLGDASNTANDAAAAAAAAAAAPVILPTNTATAPSEVKLSNVASWSTFSDAASGEPDAANAAATAGGDADQPVWSAFQEKESDKRLREEKQAEAERLAAEQRAAKERERKQLGE